jgi:predicted secreted protein
MKQDMRSKKIALVAHCVLNQNAVVGGGAHYAAIIPNVVETLSLHKFSIFQLPCPEMYAAGINRWGQVKEQYMNSGFKRSFLKAVHYTIECIEDYVNHGYQIVIIGMEGSPSCGIKITESNPSWGGTVDNLNGEKLSLISARGYFMDLLNEEISARGWGKFPSIGLTDNVDENVNSLSWFLTSLE